MGPPSDRNIIIMVEPQCAAFEHAQFNAALLRTVRLAYPSSKIVFYGEKAHLGYVRDELARIHGADRVDFRIMGIPNRKSSRWRRLPLEFSLCCRILAGISRTDISALIFCSVTNINLLSLKILMRIKRFHLPTVAIVHGALAGIARRSLSPWSWIMGFKRVLALPHPRNLRLIVLGDSILSNVKKMLPRHISQWQSLDLGYLWPSQGSEALCHPLPIDSPVCFGFLGISSKGFDVFCQLAQDIAPRPGNAAFIMVGFYNGPAQKKPICRYVPQIPDKPLSRKEFEDRLNRLSYVVWTAEPDHYRLSASATFLDALAFLKPGIYQRNDYIEYYFDRMGDIGYLCDSYEEMVAVIKAIILEFPIIRYQRQIENIRKGRIMFEPGTLAPRLRAIVDDCVA